MKIETITYKRVKNLGNFENETFQATAIITEDDNPIAASKILISFVTDRLFPELPNPTLESGEETSDF